MLMSRTAHLGAMTKMTVETISPLKESEAKPSTTTEGK